MIDHQRKLIFIHIARTGGTSVEKALVGEDWWKIEPETKHISASQARRLYGEDVWREYATFAIVRNPWDRFVSMWTIGYWFAPETRLAGNKPADFREFLRTLEPHPAEAHQTFHQHRILDEPLDFILRFENLQTDFSSMLRARNLDDVRLPVALASDNRQHYRDYYDEETKRLIAETYAIDIERFGYRF